MRVDGAVGAAEAQPRDEQIFDLFAHEFGVGFFGFHNVSPLSSECGCGGGTVQSRITVVKTKFSRGTLGGTAERRHKNKKGESRWPQFTLLIRMQCLTLWLYLPEAFISVKRRLAGLSFATVGSCSCP